MKQLPELRRRLREEEAKSRRLERENRDLGEEVARLKLERTSLKKERTSLRKERGELRKKNLLLKDKNHSKWLECLDLQKQLDEAKSEAARQAAPFRRRKKLKVDPDKCRKPGRKGGHKGSFRPVPDHVDETAEVPLSGCPQCGGVCSDVRRVEQYVEEIPPVTPHVLKIVTYRGKCPDCGEVRSRHPMQTSTAQGAAKVHLGQRALALAAYLNKVRGVTMRNSCNLLEVLTGLKITPGGLSQALDRIADRAKPQYDSLFGQLQKAPAVYADETSWWVGGPGWWLHVAASNETVVYQVRSNRRSEAVSDALGKDFKGTLVSDCLSIYTSLPYEMHRCFAHHMKAIAQARDRPDTKDPAYLKEWSRFFKTAIVLHGACAEMEQEQFDESVKGMERWRDRLIAEPGLQLGDQVVWNRLKKQRQHLLGCLKNPAAEPTNNRAERALRPAVIARKLSCGNKTERGKTTWEILASLGATYQLRDVDFVAEIAAALPLVGPNARQRQTGNPPIA